MSSKKNPLKTAQNGSIRLQIGSCSDDGFLGGLVRKFIKRTKTGPRSKKVAQTSPKQRRGPNTAPQLKMAQNGLKMEVAIVVVAAQVMVVFMALNQTARMAISSFFPGFFLFDPATVRLVS